MELLNQGETTELLRQVRGGIEKVLWWSGVEQRAWITVHDEKGEVNVPPFNIEPHHNPLFEFDHACARNENLPGQRNLYAATEADQ